MSVPVHRSRERTPGDRGRTFGRARAAAVENTVAAYRRLFAAARGLDAAAVRAIGDEVGELLAERWPRLGEEIAGIAAGSCQDERDLLAVNARTEILAGAGPPECSLIGAGTILAQNWDFHPDLRASRVVWVVEASGGHWWATFTEAGILAKIGLNGAGVGVGLNLLATSADGGPLRTPIHVLLRLLLERCDRLADALELLRGARVCASSSITLGHPDDGIAAVELSPGGAAVVTADRVRPLLHTNHFLLDPAAGTDTTRIEWPDTLDRLAELRRRAPSEPVIDALRSHAGHPRSICRHEDPGVAYADRSITLASVVMDLGARTMLVADGAPCAAPHEPIDVPASTPRLIA